MRLEPRFERQEDREREAVLAQRKAEAAKKYKFLK